MELNHIGKIYRCKESFDLLDVGEMFGVIYYIEDLLLCTILTPVRGDGTALTLSKEKLKYCEEVSKEDVERLLSIKDICC